MSDTMVERGAKAVGLMGSERGIYIGPSLCRDIARVVIEAMREPTEAMVDALMNGAFDAYKADVVEAYQAAIDAALATPEKT